MDPKTSGFGFGCAEGEHADRSIFGDDGLALQGTFADVKMGQERRPRAATLDKGERQHRPSKLFAAFAGKTWAGDLVDVDLSQHVIHLLGRILFKLAQCTTEVPVILGREEFDVAALDVTRIRTVLCFVLCLIGREIQLGRNRSFGYLDALQ